MVRDLSDISDFKMWRSILELGMKVQTNRNHMFESETYLVECRNVRIKNYCAWNVISCETRNSSLRWDLRIFFLESINNKWQICFVRSTFTPSVVQRFRFIDSHQNLIENQENQMLLEDLRHFDKEWRSDHKDLQGKITFTMCQFVFRVSQIWIVSWSHFMAECYFKALVCN